MVPEVMGVLRAAPTTGLKLKVFGVVSEILELLLVVPIELPGVLLELLTPLLLIMLLLVGVAGLSLLPPPHAVSTTTVVTKLIRKSIVCIAIVMMVMIPFLRDAIVR